MRQHWLRLTGRRRSIAFRLATAPGVVLHELAHRLSCLLVGVPVTEVAYFQLTGPPGYVRHTMPPRWSTAVLIALSPAVGNVTVAATLLLYSLAVYTATGLIGVAGGLALWWVAIAALIHSLPSTTDLGTVWAATTARWYRLPLAVVVGPLYALRRLAGHIGSYRLTVPLSLAAFGGLAALAGLSPHTFFDCVLAGRWGCWAGAPRFGAMVSAASELLSHLRTLYPTGNAP
jgi:hypothetical protein